MLCQRYFFICDIKIRLNVEIFFDCSNLSLSLNSLKRTTYRVSSVPGSTNGRLIELVNCSKTRNDTCSKGVHEFRFANIRILIFVSRSIRVAVSGPV